MIARTIARSSGLVPRSVTKLRSIFEYVDR